MAVKRTQSAFTLLELVLVLVVIAVMMAMAAPSLQGWSKNSRLRDAGDQFFAAARYARTRAISDAKIHRLMIDPQSASYQVVVQQGQDFTEIKSVFGQKVTLSSGLQIELFDMDEHPLSYIDFYPTGQTQPGQVRIGFERGTTQNENFILIASQSPNESYSIISGR